MAKKIDWLKIWNMIKTIGIPLAQQAAESGFKFRKTTKTEISELKEQVSILKEAVEKLIEDKIVEPENIESDGSN